ncbi:hypothetical protein BCR41DRAFT_90335 [Lobosporangium transversale]|uniref:Uncharacterized protein n=1 Tax=Lobosporangium transversale TaxID=64571 RepID=A0A1Y2GMD8_9FUNG|nr:hypothetical protein BCR41DRAFT_90335 [Lobosporangium transversale]ORZ13878.1 hypothetical protein BCR41DRAFT_90335 [Lobosporangium transversale]|eukprot:XP_021880662.1 hypothetical protein BCR41DRAFT_90335 [Lobosporangium transversale]
MEDSRGGHHSYNSSSSQGHNSDRYPNQSSSSQQHYQQQQQHSTSSYSSRENRGHSQQQQQQQQQQQFSRDPDAGSTWRSPITPTTTNRFNRMAIHEVIDNHPQQNLYGHEEDSPPYRRRGSHDEMSLSDPPAPHSSVSHGGAGSHPQSRAKDDGLLIPLHTLLGNQLRLSHVHV